MIRSDRNKKQYAVRGNDTMQIKVYTADVVELENEELFRYVYSRVTPVRKEKTDRMRFDSDKRLTLGAGALLEAVISSLGVKDLLFVEEQNGKPKLSDRDDIRFNISHSGTKVMCAVSDHDIGCDTERITDIDIGIAKRFFFSEEYKVLTECSGIAERKDMFFRLWTLKESFMKATGLGFGLALDSFCVIPGSDAISLRQTADSRKLYFREYFLNDGYRYAVCSAERPDIPDEMSVCSFRELFCDNKL